MRLVNTETGKSFEVYATEGVEFGRKLTYYHAKNYPFTIDSETLKRGFWRLER